MSSLLTRCCGCGAVIRSGEVGHHSGLYGATNEMVLDQRCYEEEEHQIEEKGTNDVPELLRTYHVHKEEVAH